MNTYFDTGVLVKMYVQEENSAEALALIRKAELPLPLTHLHEIELSTAIRLKRFRNELSLVEEKEALRLLATDVVEGRLQRPEYDLAMVFHRGEALSARHAAISGARSLDLLHIAAALEINCRRFCSFDERQRRVAAREGLTVVPR